MNIEDLIFMRHELLLTAALVIVMLAGSLKNVFSAVSLKITFTGIFLLVMIMGFLPVPDGILFGGMFLASPLPTLLKNILNCAVLIVILQSLSWLGSTGNSVRVRNLFALTFTSLLGMYIMLSAGHFIVLWMGMELAALPLAALSMIRNGKRSSPQAAISIMLASGMSSAAILYGISITYGICGTLFFSELITIHMSNTLQVLAFFIILAGMLVKTGIVPFNLWRASIHEKAPECISSFLSAVLSGSMIIVLIIMLYSIFPGIPLLWQKSVFFISLVSLSAGNIAVLMQKNMNRFIAWSTGVQAGYILAGIIGRSQLAMTSVIFYTIAFAFSTLALSGVVAAFRNSTGKDNIADLKGLSRSNPVLAMAMTLSLLSLAGIPPLAGFFGRFFTFAAAAEKGFFFFLLILAANTLVSLYYYLNLIRTIYSESNVMQAKVIKIDFAARLALVICVAGIILTGFAGPLFELIRNFSFGV